LDFGFKKVKEPLSGAFLFRNINQSLTTFSPPSLPDFRFKKAEEPLSGAFLFRNINQPMTTFNPFSLPDFRLRNRSILREDLNTVAKLLKHWSRYLFLVL
jgi:hypothetical protein